MKVLVVDDNRELAGTIQDTLESEGLEVMSAKDGEEGYRVYLRFKPDLVITDIEMPGENGLEMMAHIRAHKPMVETIYMSGDVDAFQQPLEWEMKRYPVNVFEKPFSMESLRAVVAIARKRPASARPLFPLP